jgi:exodeoxyribonuclease-1
MPLVEWGQRHELLDQLADDRLRQFGLRLIYLERPDVLVDETHREITARIRERMFSTDESVPWMTVPKALSRIEQLLINAATDIKNLLGEVRAYLLNLSAQHGS